MKTPRTSRLAFAILLMASATTPAFAQLAGPGSALSFDGASGFVQVPHSAALDAYPLTVTAWFKTSQTNSTALVNKYYAGSFTGYQIYIDQTGIRASYFRDGANNVHGALDGGPVADGQWHHVAFVVDATGGRLYLDGTLRSALAWVGTPGPTTTSQPLSLASSPGSTTTYFNGQMDEVSIWNVARTQGQIQASMHRSLVGSETGLAGYWRMDENSGTQAGDSSGNGRTAALFGGIAWRNSTAPFIAGAGSALNFNSTLGQWVSIPHQANLNPYPLTVMTWFKFPTNAPGGGALINKYVSASNNGFQLFTPGRLKAWYFRDAANNVFNAGVMDAGPVNDGLWHHAAMVVDAAGGRLYLDGVLKSSVPWTGTPGPATTTQPLALGLYPGDSFWNGQLDEPSIWNTNLSVGQIQTSMNHPLAGTEAGLVGYWRLDEGSGTNTVDATTNGYNGTLSGNPTWIASGAPLVVPDPGYSVNLNGNNSYVQVPNGVWFSNSFTVEGWVYARSYNNWSRLFDFGNAGYLQEVYLALSADVGGYPTMGIFNNGNAPLVGSTNQLPLNRWTHLAAAFDGTNGAIYINAKLSGIGPIPVVPPNVIRTNNYFGRSLFGGDGYANAIFDEIRIWNVARTQAQLRDSMNRPLAGGESGLAGYWRLDEGTGALAVDATGNGNNGNLINGPTWRLSRAPVDGAPQMSTLPAVYLAGTSMLQAVVNPNGLPTTVYFVYGTNIAYGFTNGIDVGNGTSSISVSNILSGLTSGLLYHFQIVASNVVGVTYSGDFTFVNQPFAELVSSIPPVLMGSMTWGDYDNDGYLDLLLTTARTGKPVQMWRNLGNDSFTNLDAGLGALSLFIRSTSAFGDYNNDGSLDLLLAGSDNNGTGPATSQIWRNLGNSTYSIFSAAVTGVQDGSVVWADFNNDGKQDLLLAGGRSSVNGGVGEIWLNNGDGTFTKSADVLGGGEASAAVADFDNDGFLDCVVSGYAFPFGDKAEVWHNNGNGTFTKVFDLPGMLGSAVAVGDFDNDGYPDIVLSGVLSSTPMTQIWRNNHNLTFTNSTNLQGVYHGTVAVGDYDNDGYSDVLLTGDADRNNSFPVSQLWRNFGNGTFANANANLPGVVLGTAAWADFENDGRLDFAIAGQITGAPYEIGKLYRNQTAFSNTAPTAPSGLLALPSTNGVLFRWNASLDAQTPAAGLTYNVRVGTNSGGSQILSPLSNVGSGVRRVTQRGNAEQRLSLNLTNLILGATYYWSVQAIDTAFAGSPFAPENRFVVGGPLVLTGPATQVTFTSANLTGTLNPNGQNSGAWFQFGTTTSYGSATPTVSVSGVAGVNLTNALTGLIPSVVYHYRLVATNNFGTNTGPDLTFVTPTPLPPDVTTLAATGLPSSSPTLNGLVTANANATAAWFQWGTTTNYGNTTPKTLISSSSSTAQSVANILAGLTAGVYHCQLVATNMGGASFGVDLTFSIPPFLIATSSLPALYLSSVAWGDFNNDGLLDLLLSGLTTTTSGSGICQVWQNLGNGSFSNINVGLPGVAWSSVALADFDNDGLLDILLTGNSSSGLISQIWRNQGDGTFANINVPLPGVNFGSVACTDFDKDGYVDLVLTGIGASGRLTQVWRNLGGGSFQRISVGLPAVRESSVAWADFDNDGFPDLLLTGGGIAQIWHNNQDGTFANLNVDLPEVAYSSVAVGDFDNDGRLDILLSGSTDSTSDGAVTQLIRNLGNGSFTNVSVDLPAAWLGSSAWGDFNNDGRLDFLLTGFDSNTSISTWFFQNFTAQTNNPPSPPTGLAAVAAASGVSLSWNSGADAQTPTQGLTYNVRVGTNSGGGQILSAESGSIGFRRVAQPGNAQQRLNENLRGLFAGTTYYWSVQSIDSSYAGSAFAAEGTFVVGAPGVVTGPPAIVSSTSEQLSGSVNPNGVNSTAWFQWGTSTNYGNNTTPLSVSGTNLLAVNVSTVLSGLSPGALYHYRLVGTNGFGMNRGLDGTFTTPTAPTVSTLAAGPVVATSALLNGTVLPNNAPTLAWFQWGTSASYGATSAPVSLSATNLLPVALSNLLINLSPNTLYHFALVASNIAGVTSGGDRTFTTPGPSVPLITSLAPNGITPNHATLNGAAAPNGAATAAWFQWGATASYGNNTASFAINASNLSAVSFSSSLSGLAGATLYYYRLVATNSAGASFGPGLTFATLPIMAPTVTTLAASAVSPAGATLNGSVNPNGADTIAWFQYGTNSSYGSTTPAFVISASSSAAVPASASLTGLIPGTIYHFQLVATNGIGFSAGADMTFLLPLFTATNAGLPNLFYSSIAWGDFNNDGALDIAISGFNGTNAVTELWQNLGNGVFAKINGGLSNVYAGALAWGDYDNDGYLDLLVTGAGDNGTPHTQLWHNNANGSFTENSNTAFPAVFFGAVAWCDYDDDGKRDIVLTGANASFTPTSQLWHNEGNGVFAQNTNVGFAQVYASAVAWGDYDKDGRADLLLAGASVTGVPQIQLWHNDGNGAFSRNLALPIPGLFGASLAWGDYDNDGMLDILASGNDGTSVLTQVWHNDGNGVFTVNSIASLPGVSLGSAAWGDYDNDGKLDILLAGNDASATPLTQIWHNNGDGTFSAANLTLPGLYYGAAAWGDFDNNGKLDILLSGATTADGPPPVSQLWVNAGSLGNNPPAVPSGLNATLQRSGQVLLTWNPANDPQTGVDGLSYNLRIGTQPGRSDVLAPQANVVTGFRRLPQVGNMHENLFAFLSRLSPGNYYWSVQAIDTSFAGSLFAAESTFTVTPPVNSLGTTALLEGPTEGMDTVVLSIFPEIVTWTATANAAWLHLDSENQSGTGSRNVLFSYDANSGATRVGSLTIAGQTLTITQAGSTYVPATPVTTLVSSGLSSPYGLAVDPAGNVYMADVNNYALKKWTRGNNTVTALIESGLSVPSAVAVDNSGNVYVADRFNNAIKKWTAANSNVTAVVSSGLNQPTGVAVDSAGNVYIADALNNAIKKWTAANGSVSIVVSAGLFHPFDVAVDLAGNLYIADLGHQAIKKWTAANNSVTTLVSSGLNDPFIIAVDGSGNVYIADSLHHVIKKWTAANNSVTVLPVGGLYNPYGVAVDAAGNVYIADSGNNAIKGLPYAFVDASARLETPSAGDDALPVALPSTVNLLDPFAPISDQPWLSINGVANGIVSFSFTANTTASIRAANIILLGQTIPVTQAAGVTVLQPILGGATMLANGSFQFSFTNNQGASFTVLSTTNVSLPLSNWTVVGTPTNTAPNVFQFTTQPAINDPQRFYGIRSP